MTKNNITPTVISLSDKVFTSSLSALKYLYSGLGDSFISMPSGVKDLTALFSNGRLRLNHTGIIKYVIKRLEINKIQRIILSVFNRSKLDEIVINPVPVNADERITFRSLLKNLAIFYSRILVWFLRLIIPQKFVQVSSFLAIIFVFTNFSVAVASEECLAEISKYEQLYHIPTGLLKAVSKVESEYNSLALNDGLEQHKFKTRGEVIDRINYLLSIGKTNFDIGCMQINYHWHKQNFSSVEEMLDVSGNVRYAASLIHGLYKQHGTWQTAVRHYHSYEPSFHKQYSKKIALAWLQETKSNELF